MTAVAAALAAQDRKPYPIFTDEQFIAAMKTIGQAFAAVNVSLAKAETDDGKAYLAISRDRLATTITFWRDRKKDDAIKMLRDTLATLDELDAALSAEQVDRTTVSDLARKGGAECERCHAAYRDQDPATKAYRFKAGTVQ